MGQCSELNFGSILDETSNDRYNKPSEMIALHRKSGVKFRRLVCLVADQKRWLYWCLRSIDFALLVVA